MASCLPFLAVSLPRTSWLRPASTARTGCLSSTKLASLVTPITRRPLRRPGALAAPQACLYWRGLCPMTSAPSCARRPVSRSPASRRAGSTTACQADGDDDDRQLPRPLSQVGVAESAGGLESYEGQTLPPTHITAHGALRSDGTGGRNFRTSQPGPMALMTLYPQGYFQGWVNARLGGHASWAWMAQGGRHEPQAGAGAGRELRWSYGGAGRAPGAAGRGLLAGCVAVG